MTDVPGIVKMSFLALKAIALYFMAFWCDLARQLMNKLSFHIRVSHHIKSPCLHRVEAGALVAQAADDI
jgi:hypothetical protein